MRQLFAILAVALLPGIGKADDVVWRPAAPLASTLAADGRLVRAAPEPVWADRPLARLGLPTPVPVGTHRPRTLPGAFLPLPRPTRSKILFAADR